MASHFGGTSRKKRKLAKNTFSYGEEVIFKSEQKILCGWIISQEDNLVVPVPPPDDANNIPTLTKVLSSKDKPVSMDTCRHNDVSKLLKGARALLVKQMDEIQFREMQVCTILDWVDSCHIWASIEDGGIVSATIHELYSIPIRYADIKRKIQALDCEIVLRDILTSMCSQVDRVKEVQRLQIININQLETTVESLRNDNVQLITNNTTLSQQNEQLQTTVNVEVAKTPLLLEKRTGLSTGVLHTRPKGSTGKFATSVTVSLPGHDNPSSDAYQATLDKRVADLKKVLHVISSREEPRREDLVKTLGAFFRKNTQLVREAAEEADISWHTALTPAESNDLKLLLRLPWKRFNELRTFLNNKGISILASDGKMREQLNSRRSDDIEVGSFQMKKTVSATPTKVGFARTRNLEKHITDLLVRHMKQKNLWQHQEFRDEIWIKIGGDKGGSSTKLAVQICNVKKSNSADNTDLLSFFEATDTDENMRLIFSIYRDAIEQMQRPEFELNLGPEIGNMRCRVFLFGDYEFLCKTLGHMGPNSSYPCLWCNIKLDALRNPRGQPHSPKVKDAEGNWIDREGWPSDRTVEGMKSDVENNITFCNENRGTTVKANSSNHHSLHARPIIPITTSTEHIVPPILHIMLGLVQRFFNMLELVCKTMDPQNIEARDLDGKWEQATEKLNELLLKQEEEQDKLAMAEVLLEGFRKSSRGEEEGGASPPCAMPACAISCVNPWEKVRNARDRVKWFQCVECGDGPNGEEGWFHLSCVGLGLSDYENENFQFLCPVCDGEIDGPGDVVRAQVDKIKQMKKDVKKAKESHTKQEQELARIYAEVAKNMGPRERELNRVLEENLKVKRQSYHSQCFVGNHCEIILQQHDKLVDVIDGHPEQLKYRQLFAKTHDILIPYSRSEFLTQDQVDELCDRCYDFGVWFPTNFVNERIPPKFHMVVCALPKCAQTWLTLGLLSEHGLEGVHAQCNADERTYCRVRDNEKRINLVYRQHGNYATTDKAAMETKKRRCQIKDCKGRYITISKVKRCNLCYSHPEGVLT